MEGLKRKETPVAVTAEASIKSTDTLSAIKNNLNLQHPLRDVNGLNGSMYQTPILLKGYHPDLNPGKDYKTAKTPRPASVSFTKADYDRPTQTEIDAWVKEGGWVGHLVPKGMHVIDVEDPNKIQVIRDICRQAGITVPVNQTNNGVQFVFRVSEENSLGGQSEIITRSGLPVTYRAGGKNYVILPPTNRRTWDNEDQLKDPPLMPELLYPARGNVEDTVREIAWELGVAYRAGKLSGYDDLDAGFMALLVSCEISEPLVLDAFELIFLDTFDEHRTMEMFKRTNELLSSNQPFIGIGSLIKKLQEEGLNSIVELVSKLQRLTEKEEESEGTSNKPKKPSKTDRLIKLALRDFELFHDEDNNAYATIQADGHHETFSLKSGAFEMVLSRLFWDECGESVNGKILQDVIRTLGSHAVFEGDSVKQVHVRLAEKDGTIYLDLGNDAHEVVEITSEGWRVVSDQNDVKFRRPQGMSALPNPKQGGDIDLLKEYINLENINDFPLLIGFILMCFNPWGPYPIMVFTGEQGSAKSTGQRVIKRLTDPSKAPLRSIPSNLENLAIAAFNSWVLGFDNLSYISNEFSDAFCRLSTGGGFATRTLYTNGDQKIFETKCPLILNGITNFVRRNDLADRSLMIELAVIPDEKRKAEADFWEAFEQDAPEILGAILTGVSGALRNYKDTSLTHSPRMADFAVWVTAAEEAVGWENGHFMKAYSANRKEINSQTLDNDLVGAAVKSFMIVRASEPWEGTATDLLSELNNLQEDTMREADEWPQSPVILSGRLTMSAPALRAEGIEVSKQRTSGKRIIRLERIYQVFIINIPEMPPWIKVLHPGTPEGIAEMHLINEKFLGGIVNLDECNDDRGTAMTTMTAM